MTTALANLSRAVQMLAEARTLDEITHIRSMAQAAEQYARAEKLGTEAEGHAHEIRLRAARKAGEVLEAMKRSGERRPVGVSAGGGRNTGAHGITPPTLSDLGITSDKASRWQRIAAVPEEDFENAIAEGRGEEAIAQRAARKQPSPKAIRSEHGKRSPTMRQSLRGLQQAAIQIQALAEALDGQLLGDWSQLYGVPEAEQAFDVIAANLPVLNARVKRALRERGSHGTATG